MCSGYGGEHTKEKWRALSLEFDIVAGIYDRWWDLGDWGEEQELSGEILRCAAIKNG